MEVILKRSIIADKEVDYELGLWLVSSFFQKFSFCRNIFKGWFNCIFVIERMLHAAWVIRHPLSYHFSFPFFIPFFFTSLSCNSCCICIKYISN
jgi:hypothetical protein